LKRFDWKKALSRGVVTLFCFFLVGGVVWGADSVLGMEGTAEPYVPAESASPYPSDAEAVADYLNAAIAKAIAEKPKLTSSAGCDIDEASIAAGESAELLAAARYIRGDVQARIEGAAVTPSAGFGEALAGKVAALRAAPGDILSAACAYVYYECPVCEAQIDAEIRPDPCPECGGETPLLKRARDTYTITITLADNAAAAADTFRPAGEPEIRRIFNENARGYYRCEAVALTRKNPQITAEVNRLNDQLLNLTFKVDTAAALSFRFAGGSAHLGTVPVSFAYTETLRLDFTWPGIALSPKSLSLEPKSTEALKAALTCENPLEETVSWSVSDASIASVDAEGYVKAAKKTGVVTVTARFEFQGKTYADTCEVHVKKSVESLRVSKRRLTLAEGETWLLEARVSPRKATVRTVRWISENEKVAVVDQNGLVTAAGAGETAVYAVSDDGWYKSTCRVEVTG